MAIKPPPIKIVPLGVSMIITDKAGKPCLELRKSIYDLEVIKNLISCAFHEKPIVIQPVFNDKLRAISSLINKGLIVYENEEFYFTL